LRQPRRRCRAGEKGPELFVPKTAGTIIPNDVLTGKGRNSNEPAQQSNVVNLHINVPPMTSRSLADQIASATGSPVQRALRRNGLY
jgi:hypothetical protein